MKLSTVDVYYGVLWGSTPWKGEGICRNRQRGMSSGDGGQVRQSQPRDPMGTREPKCSTRVDLQWVHMARPLYSYVFGSLDEGFPQEV